MAAPASASAVPAAVDPRRPAPGVGVWYSGKVDSLLRDSGTSWYHTWAPHHDWITTPAGSEFVPMVWGAGDVTASSLQRAAVSGQTLLGFHKPDESGGANLSPSAALSLWPQLEATGMRLGAPAVARAHQPGGWLDTFIADAARQGRRVDFVPLHWYPDPSILGGGSAASEAVEALRQYLTAVHSRFGLPLWLTELSLIGWGAGGPVVPPPAVQAEFLAAADAMMADLGYVERWAWFSLTPFSTGEVASLYSASNAITPVGEQFRAIAGAGEETAVEGGPTALGVGAWYSGAVDALLLDSGASWYHTWAPHHDWITAPPECEFVPMIWGRDDVTEAALQQATDNGEVLLGFNEPDRADQANLSAQDALSLWPQLEATGLRLGAPCVSHWAQARGGWLDTFLSGLGAQGGRVDFIPLHWYPSPAMLSTSNPVDTSVNELSQYLRAVHSRFGLPLWLTEFSLIGWSSGGDVVPGSSVQAEFLAAAESMMAELGFVERCAWFSLTPFTGASGASLYGSDNAITAAGLRFREIATA